MNANDDDDDDGNELLRNSGTKKNCHENKYLIHLIKHLKNIRMFCFVFFLNENKMAITHNSGVHYIMIIFVFFLAHMVLHIIIIGSMEREKKKKKKIRKCKFQTKIDNMVSIFSIINNYR